jgi:flagellar secretion chaperone FliS
MAINPAAAYLNNKINTATPAELTLMLYDGSIKFCNIAIMAVDNQDFDKANTNIIKAENIIQELRSTLDFTYEISNNLKAMYDYIYTRLVQANIKKEKEILEEVLEYLRDLRDAWKEAMKTESKIAQ